MQGPCPDSKWSLAWCKPLPFANLSMTNTAGDGVLMQLFVHAACGALQNPSHMLTDALGFSQTVRIAVQR